MPAEALYSPNAYARLPLISYYNRNDEPLFSLAGYTPRPDDHHLLSLLSSAGVQPDLLLRDCELVLRQEGHGRRHIDDGALLFSPDRKQLTTHTNQIQRRGGAILFPSGQRFPRSECWTLTLNQNITCIRTTYQTRRGPLPDTTITRPDRQCSVCLEDLTGDLATCPNDHQIHHACYDLLGSAASLTRRACPECRTAYSPAEQERLAANPDRVALHRRLVYPAVSRRDADLRFVGLLRRVLNHYELPILATLDTLDYWVRTPRADYLLDCDEEGTPFYNGTDRPAWRDFLTYYLSAENRERLKKRELNPMSHNANYGEAEFFADLLRQYPLTAQEILAEVRTDAERTALRRECWVQHRLTDALTKINALLNRFIATPDGHYTRVQPEERVVE